MNEYNRRNWPHDQPTWRRVLMAVLLVAGGIGLAVVAFLP